MCLTNKCKLLFMFFVTLFYFVVEITYGYKLSSVALIADSYLMFSNVVALAVACLSVILSKKKSIRNTYGWARVEILGVLINTVFLTGLCFLMVIHGVKRTFEPSPVKEPKTILLIGIIGFIINIIGLVLFRDSTTVHCDCFTSRLSVLVNAVSISKHSIGNKSERSTSQHNLLPHASSTFIQRTSFEKLSKTNLKRTSALHRLDQLDEDPCKDEIQLNNLEMDNKVETTTQVVGNEVSHLTFNLEAPVGAEVLIKEQNTDNNHGRGIMKNNELVKRSSKNIETTSDKEDANINARKGNLHLPNETKPHNFWYNCKFTSHLHTSKVIFHIVADGLGAIMLMLSSLCIIHFDDHFVQLYTDPMACIILSILTLYIVHPLLKASALILIQSTPQHIDVPELKKKLLQKYKDDIISIHEFHVWQLEGNRIIATLHIKFYDEQRYIALHKKIQCYFHQLGVHSVTIQPEFLGFKSSGTNYRQSHCEILCPQDGKLCQKSTCCGPQGITKGLFSSASFHEVELNC
uniref:Cation diffusion facilitator family protein 1 n=1 Tax=Cacopsylla melanoneura TaxID=428564 RepID=A0A8D9F7G6_9HEMI